MAKDLLAEQPKDLFAENVARGGRIGDALREAFSTVERRDPGIDYSSGLDDAGFRAGFSRMSDDEEKSSYLDKNIGKGLWGKDSFGAYFIKPEGMAKFGKTATKPVSLDEQRSTGYDVADWAGDALPIAGGVIGGTLGARGGPLGAIAGAGLGTVIAKSADEVAKNLQGYRKRPATEIGTDIAAEGALSALGEGAFQVLRPIAKWFMGPGASRMTPERAALAKEAKDQGFHVRPGQVTDAPLLSRWEGMVQNIFGDLYGEQNRKAAMSRMGALQAGAGPSPGMEAAGKALSDSLRTERVKFGEEMSRRYAQIDREIAEPFIPTQPLKKVAQEIMDTMPKDAEGNIILASKETQQFLNSVLNAPQHWTAAQMQQARTILREASEADNLVPGISKHHARLLRAKADEAFTDAASPANAALVGVDAGKAKGAIDKLRSTDADYRVGIRKFSNPVASRITRDATQTGAVDPDMVVEYVIKPGHAVRAREIKKAVEPGVWDQVKAAHAEDLLKGIVRETDDPFKQVFDGKAFRDGLNKFGRETMTEVHGKQWVDDAYKFADALMLASKKAKLSGGIVAANVALHPVANLPKLVWMRALVKVMEQPGTFKYLTEGLKVGPETKEGAAALSRFTAQLIAHAEDETGSARFNLTEPPGQ